MIKCNICHTEYEDNNIPHYCKKCGKNLSNEIEKSDVLLFLSKFFPVVACILIGIVLIPSICLDGSCFKLIGDVFQILIIVLSVILFIVGDRMKKQFYEICKSKIENNKKE